jgi:hypothetical protein
MGEQLNLASKRLARRLLETAAILLAIVYLSLFGLILAELGRERAPAPWLGHQQRARSIRRRCAGRERQSCPVAGTEHLSLVRRCSKNIQLWQARHVREHCSGGSPAGDMR